MAVSGVLAGCGGGYNFTSGSVSVVMHISGAVQAGGHGVSGSTVQLYTVGSTGNGSAATPMFAQPLTTDVNGDFDLIGAYQCGESASGSTIPAGSNQVYLVATGGVPASAGGANNAALTLVTALGPCNNLNTMNLVVVNELTTVAAAWALAPFMSGATHVGATATNSLGIDNAFLDAGLLANPATGGAVTLASNLQIENAKLNALADAISSCAYSAGGGACAPLFAAATPSGGTAPTDTLTAALNIVKHPGQNVAAVYTVSKTNNTFATTFTKSPNDWTMSLTVTGGGLNMPTDLGIDAQNNVWVVGQDSPLSAFGPQGTPLSANGFGKGDVTQAYGLTVSSVGDIWVTNYNAIYNGPGAVTKFLGAESGTPGQVVLNGLSQPGFYDSSVAYPYAVAADTNGNIFIANNDSSSATVYNNSGQLVSPSLGANTGIYAFPQAIAVDNSHGFWLSDSDNTVAHISSNGVLLGHPNCCVESYGLATDAQGNVWIADYLGGIGHGAFAEVNGTTNAVTISGSTVGGIQYPAMVAIDAAQNVWFSNYHGNSITEIQGNGGGGTAGVAISPSVGVYTTGGYGLDAGLNAPYGIGPDRSGNVWVSNIGEPSVMMFFGLATPTVTPVTPVPTAP